MFIYLIDRTAALIPLFQIIVLTIFDENIALFNGDQGIIHAFEIANFFSVFFSFKAIRRAI